MSRRSCHSMAAVAVALFAGAAIAVGDAAAQPPRDPPPAREPARHPPERDRGAQPRTPAPRPRAKAPRPSPRIVVRGEVFVGGYFYDPAFGPYPWWPRLHYPYWYLPSYGARAMLRLRTTPADAAVYVDGFYAGLVDDFDGAFQGLPLTPGSHVVLLYRPGWHTERHNVYLGPGSTFTLRASLEPLAPGEVSDPPPDANRVPPPPRPGSFHLPLERWPTTAATPLPYRRAAQTPTGWLDLRVLPAGATVLIDGEHWLTSDPGLVVADLPAGTHRLHVSAPGFQSADIPVGIADGEHRAVTVSLIPAT